MNTVEVNKDTLRTEYSKANSAGKTLLKKLFDNSIFEAKITDRVKSFEDACKILKLTPAKIILKTDTKDEAAYKKLKVIAAALNEGWKPNWNDSSEYKYYPWFQMEKSFSFDCVIYFFLSRSSDVSSRLCFKNEDLAKYAATQFLPLYKEFMVI